MGERSRISVGRSTMELAIAEVRGRNDELARLRVRHEELRRRLTQVFAKDCFATFADPVNLAPLGSRLGRRMHALRSGDLGAATAEAEEPLAWQDDETEDEQQDPEGVEP